jgi:transcription antitermination factor NusG
VAVYTKPRQEKVVYTQLKKKEITVYLPLLRQRRQWSDRKKWVELPLFRSYVFARIELKNSLFVLQTVGVHHIVHFKKKIATIPDDQIEGIRKMIEGGYDPQPVQYMVVGDAVEVVEGPLKGQRGIVARIDKEDKFVIKVDAIQHAIAVHIHPGYLRPIKTHVHPVL